MYGMTNEETLAFNRQVIEEFRANDGVCGGVFEGNPMLLLTSVGAKSGQRRTSPLTWHRDGDRYVVMASAGGEPTHPAWFHNVVADPVVTVEVGTGTFTATATEATGDERQRLYDSFVAALPRFAEYQAEVERRIPVVVLSAT